MSLRFRLDSTWRLEAPRARIWRLLENVEDWPSWWPFLESARRLEGDGPESIGARYRFRWRSGLGYRLSIIMTTTRSEPPGLLEGGADGDLRGNGRWRLEDAGPGVTQLTYGWDVEPAKPWMRLLAPLLRPVFVQRHFAVMDAGARGMARKLDCRLIEGCQERTATADSMPPCDPP